MFNTSDKESISCEICINLTKAGIAHSVLSYELDEPFSIPGRSRELVSWPPRPNRFWGPPSLLSDGYQEFLSRG